jgi:hypothetical protein
MQIATIGIASNGHSPGMTGGPGQPRRLSPLIIRQKKKQIDRPTSTTKA